MEDARKRDAMIAENREEWERLLFLLRQQQPKVFWINGDTDCVWLEMLPALKEALPGHVHHEVRVNGDAPSLYRAIEEAVGPPGAHNIIHVLGMPAAVESRLFLKNLNLERELLFRRAPGHVIVWGSQPAVNIIASRAHDWWSWMAFIFPFHTPAALLNARQQGFRAELPIGDRVLSVESRDPGERIRHLKQEWEDFCESIGSAPITARMAGELADLALALGTEYREAGKYSLAAAILRKALGRCEGLLPEMKWGNLLNDLGLNLLSLDEHKEAEGLLRRALAVIEHNLGNSHPQVASCLNNLAQLLQATNRLSEAEPLMRRASSVFLRSLGGEHPNTKGVLKNYRLLLQAQDKSEAAIESAIATLPDEPL